MKVNRLFGKSVFVDTNAFVYFLQGRCSELARDIIQFSSKELARIRLVTTVRVCDELLFKMAMIQARETYPELRSNTVKKLKSRPDVVRGLLPDLRKVVDFLNALSLEVVPVDTRLLFRSLQITEEYGVFGNDALTVYVMQRRNMKFLLSSDRDFDLVPWIERIDALPAK